MSASPGGSRDGGMPHFPALLLNLQLLGESGDPRIGRNLSDHLIQWRSSSDFRGHLGNMEGEAFFIVTMIRGLLLSIPLVSY